MDWFINGLLFFDMFMSGKCHIGHVLDSEIRMATTQLWRSGDKCANVEMDIFVKSSD